MRTDKVNYEIDGFKVDISKLNASDHDSFSIEVSSPDFPVIQNVFLEDLTQLLNFAEIINQYTSRFKKSH